MLDHRRYGVAMARAIRAHATYKERPNNKITFNGWWRGGDDLNCELDVERGRFRDHKEGIGGGAVTFAPLALGMDLAEFMRRYGDDLPRANPIAKGAEVVEPEEIHAAWERLIESMPPRRNDVATRWLIEKRRFPDDCARLADSGFATVDVKQIRLFPKPLRDWIEAYIQRVGPLIAFPIRCPDTGIVANVNLRAVYDVDPALKRRHLRGARLKSPSEHPRAYGFAAAAKSSRTVVLCEGACDTIAVEIFYRTMPDTVCVGAIDAQGMRAWGEYLSETPGWSRCIVVPHLDPVQRGLAGQKAGAYVVALLEQKNARATFFDWDTFIAALQEGFTGANVADDSAINDIGDAVLRFGWLETLTAFLRATAEAAT